MRLLVISIIVSVVCLLIILTEVLFYNHSFLRNVIIFTATIGFCFNFYNTIMLLKERKQHGRKR